MDPIRGGCRCGQVAFEFDLPSRFCAHCHCEECRRSHGAALVTWVGTWRESFRILRGEESLGKYTSERQATRSFCSRCGSMLFFESPRWAGEVHVARAQIAGPIDREPGAHVFYGEHVSWMTFEDGVTKVATLPGKS